MRVRASQFFLQLTVRRLILKSRLTFRPFEGLAHIIDVPNTFKTEAEFRIEIRGSEGRWTLRKVRR